MREPSDGLELAGLPRARRRRAGRRATRARCWPRRSAGRSTRGVRDRIVAEARGNPLALLELPRGLTPGGARRRIRAAGRDAAGEPHRAELPAAARGAPGETRRLLLVAAAEPVGDAALLWRAADRLGLGAEAAAPAAAAGLIELGARVRFRHPLHALGGLPRRPVPERQRVHRALAEATDPDADPDRRAWHRAHAAAAPDEARRRRAGALRRPGAGARRHRGGRPRSSTRATELTPDPARRGARALAAAQAKLDVAAHRCRAGAPGDRRGSARSTSSSRRGWSGCAAQIAFATQRGRDAPPLLLDAARRLDALDAEVARETYLEALARRCSPAASADGRTCARSAAAARAAPPAPQPPRAIDLLLDGLATRFTEGYEAGVAPLRARARRVPGRGEPAQDDMRWLWLACRLAQDLWDDELWHELATRGFRVARETGALTLLPIALTYRAGAARPRGRVRRRGGADRGGRRDRRGDQHRPARVRQADARRLARARRPRRWRCIDWGRRSVDERGEGDGAGRPQLGHARCCTTASAATTTRSPRRSGRASTTTSACTRWSLVELVEAARARGAPRRGRGGARRLERADARGRHRLGARDRGAAHARC